MTTRPYTLTQADLEFHSQIMMEHAMFLGLGLSDEQYKNQALEQFEQWKSFIEQGYPEGELLSLINNLRQLKTTILEKLTQGEWLGWLSASFLRHILEELEHFQMLVDGQQPLPEIMAVQAWRLEADHLEDAESKTDPSEVELKEGELQIIDDTPDAIRDLAQRRYTPVELLADYHAAMEQLAVDEGQPANDVQFMIGLSLTAGEEVDRLLGHIESTHPRTIIHASLLDHWRREHQHFAHELQLALQELQLQE